jgi:glycosyltransferase involved in cell wall biosynthesis
MELPVERAVDIQASVELGKAPILSLVLPCYNEEEVLAETTTRLLALVEQLKRNGEIAEGSAIYYVDDGSRDRTWEIISSYAEQYPNVCGIKLSRNRGHQNALLCGLLTTPGDVLISLDSDLQDDLNAIPQMVHAYRTGSEIVFGVRRRRDKDTLFKRLSAESYYKFLAFMGVQIIYNHADYRLMSRRAVETLRDYDETHLFLRGLVPQLGYKSSVVMFDRSERFAGDSKYPLSKMMGLAWQGVTSFSAYPLRLITGVGILISIISLAMATWAGVIRLFTNEALPGWASTVIPMYFLGGVQLLSLGIIGEYIAKIYEASKHRPRFHVESLCGEIFSEKDAEKVSVPGQKVARMHS